MSNPLVTFIIPAYNAGRTIDVALKSILAQTLSDYEVVIVDGNSKDNTIQIVEQYKESFKHIKVLSEDDKGIYDAMNKGIRLARGEWLFFLGSDDELYSNDVFEKILSIQNINRYDVVYGNVYSARFNGIYDGEFDPAKITDRNICHQAILFRKKVFKVVGDFNLKYKAHADWDHNIRWFFNSKLKKKYVDLIVSNYADGGFSSVTSDDSFLLDKDEIFFKHAFWHFDRNNRRRLLKVVVYKKFHSNPVFKALHSVFKSLSRG